MNRSDMLRFDMYDIFLITLNFCWGYYCHYYVATYTEDHSDCNDYSK